MNAAALDATLDRAAELLGPLASRDVPVGPLTTYRVGGRASLFVEPGTGDELRAVGEAVSGTGVDVLVLGNGSNLLVADGGFAGLVVHLAGGFAGFAADGEVLRVDAGGALAYPVLARRAAALGLAGLEWAVGIPGSVGGGVRMNAGGHGADTAAVLVTARIADLASGGVRQAAATELAFGYRRSAVTASEVVVGATFVVERGEAAVCEARISEIVRWRRANQPGGQNAGSVFTNPPDDSAGRIIDSAGLKGLRIGSAEVSPKHANFIQVDSGGAADDVRRLVDEVRRLVAHRTGVELVPELRVVGGSAVTDPRFRQRRIDVARQAGRRRLRMALAAAGFVGLGVGVVGALHSPVFSARHVTVTGAPGIARSLVLAASGLADHPPLIDLDTAAVERHLLALPEVRTAVVTEHWPTGVSIALTERLPVAAAPLGAAAGVGPWALVDATGRVLAVSSRPPASLAVVLLPTPPGAPGSSIAASEMPLLAVAAGLPASLRPTVSAIAFDYAGDVVLEMHGEPMAVLGGATDLRQKFVSLATVLASVPTRGTGTIDLTVPASPVLTPSGDSRTVQGIVGG